MRAQRDLESLQQVMDQFVQNCKARIEHSQQSARETWLKIAKDHNIDIHHIAWVPDAMEPAIIPVSVNLRESSRSS